MSLPTGIYDRGHYWRVVACIGRGPEKRQERRFPKSTAVRTMTRWQEETRQALRERPAHQPGSLAADLEAYVDARLTMPTAQERRRHLELWIAALGAHRKRETVTPREIQTVLEMWRHAGLSPASCNRRRTALQSFYTVLGGKSGANPVREVPTFREPKQPPRRLDYATFERLLAAMPDRGQALRHQPRGEVSRTKARLRVMAYTGLPHAQIGQLRPEHVLWEERLVYVAGRDKGEGTDDVWLPVSRAGLEALRALFACGAVGRFSASAMYASVKRARVKIGRPDVRPYDLRHLFGQTVLRLSGNRAATRDLMLHRSDATTKRYVAAEIPGELRLALAQFDDVVGAGCGAPTDGGADDAPKS